MKLIALWRKVGYLCRMRRKTKFLTESKILEDDSITVVWALVVTAVITISACTLLIENEHKLLLRERVMCLET